VYLILRIICIASAPKSGAPSFEKKEHITRSSPERTMPAVR